MAKKKLMDLQWPMGGLQKKSSYRQQAPFSSPDCENVRPEGSIEGRGRGGSRPGLGKAFYEQIGSGNPVRLMSFVSKTTTDGFKVWQDNFRGSALGDVWSAASWIGTAPGILPSSVASISEENDVGAVRSAISDLDTDSQYQLAVFISPWAGDHNGIYKIFARMDNTTPVATTDGISAELTLSQTTDAYSGTLDHYASGVKTSYVFTGGGGSGKPTAGWFKVLVNGNAVTCYWLGNTVRAATTVGAATGARFGFGMTTLVSGGICLIDTFELRYFSSTTTEGYRRIMVASSNGTLYRENWQGQLEAVSSSLTLNTVPLQAAERAQKLYIADYGEPLAKGSNGQIANTNELDSASYADWTTIGANVNDYVVVITNGAGGTTDGTYEITTIAANVITLTTAPGNGTCSFRVERCPKIYDPVANTLTRWVATSAKGAVPTGCKLIGRYRDSIALAGADEAPHLWYLSRQSDPLDWLYSDTDAGAAVVSQGSEAGEIGEPITALIPHSDDYLLYGTEISLWVLRGHPYYGGQNDAVTRQVGIVGASAWTKTPEGGVIFLSRDGLYYLAPGAGLVPQSMSREKLPDEMIDIGSDMYQTSIEYDTRDRGVHIYMTPVSESTQRHFWFDIDSKSYWPYTLQDDHEPFAVLNYVSSVAENSAVLLGCRDGYIRRYRDKHETDESLEIASYILIGPVRLGGEDFSEGLVNQLIGAIAEKSGNITWSVITAETHESAVFASAASTGTWTNETSRNSGLNYTAHPRARGGSFILKLENAEVDRRWAIERISAVIHKLGKQRVI